MLSELTEKLQKNSVNVVFIKKDGSERKMICTLNEMLIPDSKKPKTKSQIDSTKNILAVFDTEKQDWRSINLSQVKSFS